MRPRACSAIGESCACRGSLPLRSWSLAGVVVELPDALDGASYPALTVLRHRSGALGASGGGGVPGAVRKPVPSGLEPCRGGQRFANALVGPLVEPWRERVAVRIVISFLVLPGPVMDPDDDEAVRRVCLARTERNSGASFQASAASRRARV